MNGRPPWTRHGLEAESLASVSGPGDPVLTPGPDLPWPAGGRARSAIREAATRAWRHRRAARWGPPVAAAVCAGVGYVGAGPVAAAVLAAYGAAGFVIARGLAMRQSRQRAHRLAADAVVGLAADLRAGLALAPAWRAVEEALRQADAGVLPGWRSGRRLGAAAAAVPVAGPVEVVAERVVAATTLADSCGAPLADVLERLDAHLRAVDRARSLASSQAAGARASAALLAAMPLAGVGLGALVGVDPWRVLLHTPVGAIALTLAVALQLMGLAWVARLSDVEVPL